MSTELAWAAGFFDGEGSVGCYHKRSTRKYTKRAYPSLKVTIAQSYNPHVLVRFQAAVGYGNVTGPINYGIRWQYQAGGYEACVGIARLLWPYLSPVKKRQFNKALREFKNEKVASGKPS